MMMMALFPTLKGAARPITTPITTYHIKHAPATSHKNQDKKGQSDDPDLIDDVV